MLILAFLLAVAHASEEEFIGWRTIKLDCGVVEKAGKISLTASADNTGIESFEIAAFGQTHRLSEADLKRLRGFPLNSLKVTHEAGYPQLGGHTVHFRFRKVYYDADKKLRQEDAIVSVDERHAVRVSDLKDTEAK